MSKYRWLIVLGVLCAGSVIPAAAAHWKSATSLDQEDPGLAPWSYHRQARSDVRGGRKSCSKVYAIPEESKHWTECKQGQYSDCSGPAECACTDLDDRLIWYECKEGSYAVCEDDNTCKDGS